MVYDGICMYMHVYAWLAVDECGWMTMAPGNSFWPSVASGRSNSFMARALDPGPIQRRFCLCISLWGDLKPDNVTLAMLWGMVWYSSIFFAFLRWLPWLDLDCWQSSMKYITAEKVAKPGWLPLKWSWETWWQDHHSQIRSAVAWAMLQYASSGVWLRSWWLWARQRSNCATLVLLWTWGRPLKLRTYSLVSTGRLKWSLEQGILTVVMLSYDES